MSKFKAGDVVILKAGGPAMTVRENILVDVKLTNESTTVVVCTWFIKNVDNSYSGPFEYEYIEDQLVLFNLQLQMPVIF